MTRTSEGEVVRGPEGDDPQGKGHRGSECRKEVVLEDGLLGCAHTHAHTAHPLLFHPTLSRRAPCCFSGTGEATLPSPCRAERSRVVSPALAPRGGWGEGAAWALPPPSQLGSQPHPHPPQLAGDPWPWEGPAPTPVLDPRARAPCCRPPHPPSPSRMILPDLEPAGLTNIVRTSLLPVGEEVLVLLLAASR